MTLNDHSFYVSSSSYCDKVLVDQMRTNEHDIYIFISKTFATTHINYYHQLY